MPKENILLKFWGTRGSLPTTGKDFAKCGGNTSCLEVRAGENIIIFDAGSGIKELGDKLIGEMPFKAHLFFTHYHWDHIMGLPFFTPMFIPSNEINIYGETKKDYTVRKVLVNQMLEPYFPVKFKDVFNATIKFKTIKPGRKFTFGDTTVTTVRLRHPNAAMGYAVERNGSKLVHLTDVEHGKNFDKKVIDICKGEDAIVHDCAYTPEEYKTKIGWGHSTYEFACKLANLANVKKLYLFHHDPSHSDKFMEQVLSDAKKLFKNTYLAKDHLEKWM